MRLAVAGCAALALGALAPLAPARAQSPQRASHALVSGARVRILQRLDFGFVVGTIRRARGDTMVVDTADARPERRMFFPATIIVDEFRTVAVPLAAVARIEVSTGRNRLRGAWRATRRSALATALVGGIYGLSRPGKFRIQPVAEGLAAGAALGVVIGAPYGFTRGAERWRSVTLPRPYRYAATTESGQ